jgi:hypothetical protein
MWYKTAKQGSVWSRIGPDAEAQFDELIKQATKKNESSGKLYLDINLLDQLFRKSNFKNLIIRFMLSKSMSAQGSFAVSLFDDIEKLAEFEKFIPTFLANQIKINHKQYDEFSYQRQISLLKHEFAHAITSHTIDYVRGEDYLPWGELQKKDFAETPLMQLKNNLKSNWEKISPYVNEVDPNMGFLLKDNSIPLDENLQKINNAWNIFKRKVKNKEIKVPRQIIKIINKIDNFRITTLYSSPIDAFVDNFASKKEQQRRIKIYRQRAKTLRNDFDDLYLANPEETRAHIVEFQHLFSLSLLKQYYDHLLALNVYNEKNSKQEYLEDIKEMFNILMQAANNENFSSNPYYYSLYEYANFFGLNDTFYKIQSKSNDEKFKEQLAKHLNNVYQQLKEEFEVETGSFKSLNESAIKENANDVNKKKGE